MATAVGLNMKITADTAGITRGMTRVERMLRDLDGQSQHSANMLRQLTGVQASFPGLRSAIMSLMNPMTAAAGVVAGLGAAAVLAGRRLIQLEDVVENLGNTADKLGVSFEFTQVLEEAARRSGSSIETVSAAFGRFQKTVTGVDEESKSARRALRNIGLEAADLQSLRPEAQFTLIAARIRDIEDPAKRTAAAMELFGKSGAALLPFFRNLDKAATDMERLGTPLSDAQRRKIDEFGLSMDRLAVASQGAGRQLTASFAIIGDQIARQLSPPIALFAQFTKEQNEFALQTEEFDKLRRELGRGITPAMQAAVREGKSAEEILGRATKSAQSFADEMAETAEEAEKRFRDLTRAVEDSGTVLDRVIRRGSGLGEGGFGAALAFQSQRNELRELLDENVIGVDEFKRGIQVANDEFDRQIALVEQANRLIDDQAKAADKVADALSRARDSADRTFDTLVSQASDFGQEGFAVALKAQEQIEELRALLDDDELNADQFLRGIANVSEQFSRQLSTLKEQLRVTDKIDNINKRIADREKDIEDRRLDNLRRPNQQALNLQDVRTGGISQVLASMRQDPAIEEYRKQLRELQRIRQELELTKVDLL